MLTTTELTQLLLGATGDAVAYSAGIAVAVAYLHGVVTARKSVRIFSSGSSTLRFRLNGDDGRRLLIVSLSTGFSRLMVVLVMIWRFEYR